MQSFISIYKFSPLTPVRQSWVLSCAASVLLTLVAAHVEPVQAQDVQGIDVDLGRAMQKQPPGQQGGQQSGGQRTPIPLSDSALLRITNMLKNLTPAGRDILLSKTYTPEERQQILGYMQSQNKQQEVTPQPQPQELTLEQRRQLMSAPQSEMTQQQTVPEEVKKTEQLTMEQQKSPPKTLQQQEQVKEEVKQPRQPTPATQVPLVQPAEQQKLIEQALLQQVQTGGKAPETPMLEQQKQTLTQQQLEQGKQQQLKQEIQQSAKQEQTQTILPAKPGNPTTTAQEKYQKLLDAGVFTAGSGSTANPDATMTREQFAAIAARLQALASQSGGTSSELSPFGGSGTQAALTLKPIEGITQQTVKVVSDDKKSSADFLALLEAFSKQLLSQEELDKLIAKVGAPTTAGSVAVAPGTSSTAISKASEVVAAMNNPPGSGVSLGGIAYSGTGLAGIQAALAAATAAATSASDNAKNIALTNTVNALAGIGADYNVVTPRANFPTNLNATFSGRMAGTLSNNTAVGANLTMSVNFATVGSGAPIGGNIQFDNNKGSASFTNVGYGFGYVGGGMSGTYDGQAMNGFIQNGQFFGPAANAVKGGWSMTTNSVSGGGTFAATR